MKLKKLNVMKTPPDISDAEIQAMMDFDKVLEAHRSANKTGRFIKPVLWITGTAVVLLVAGWIAFKPTQPVETITSASTETLKPEVSTLPKEEQETPTPATESKGEASLKKSTPIKSEPEVVPSAADVYTEAEPLSGYPDLYAYFQRELTYPVEALKDSVQGIVSVSFVIGKDGKPGQIKILNSLGTAFDNEAMRVITNMPEWKPASLNGKAMPARISMPLTFQIERTPKQP